ncbi:glycosyl hydrolase family 8 [Roseococcus sp. YIM B11640]|uniref:glycosyl hydrolase family 8 n=1 Tax=Roseococcus sp. YIM B11640 TaxID=3133973 RepID=UPI003C7C7E93
MALAAGSAAAQPAAPSRAAGAGGPDLEWRAFKNRYVANGGRVIDTANNGISHSEGQGYGMFFAVEFDDKATFDQLWGWTRQNLQRQRDSLFAWRYDPRSSLPVSDTNNATDGDIYIAWALLKAFQRWSDPSYRAYAARMTEDILRCCVTEAGGRTVLLPGTAGFRGPEGTVVNLSYYAFPALRSLSRLVADRRWSALERDGLDLMRQATFGGWELPPDWLLLPASGRAMMPAPAWPPRFSWDAVRVPLNLAWLRAQHPVLSASYRFWSHPDHRQKPPAWVDLRTGQIPSYPGHAGVRAVMALAAPAGAEAPVSSIRVAQAPDYFAAALVLQAQIAAAARPEPPAVDPPEEVAQAAPGIRGRITSMGSSLLSRVWGADENEGVAAPAPAVAPAVVRTAPSAEEPPPVRGMRSGLRGLTAPR